jgi:anti-anti-sigma regulatory factor
MAGNQLERGSGEVLRRQEAFVPSCAPSAATKDAPDRVTGAGTSEAAASQDSAAPAGCAAPGRPPRGRFGNEIFSIAHRSDPACIILAGEFDFPSLPQLTAALLDAADGSGVLHVDLADVYFCDLAALRTIVGLGQHSGDQQPRRKARSLVLHNVPAHIEEILRIVGWDTIPGLTIDTGRTTTRTQQPAARSSDGHREKQTRPPSATSSEPP